MDMDALFKMMAQGDAAGPPGIAMPPGIGGAVGGGGGMPPGMPDLKSIPGLEGMDMKDMEKHVSKLWRHLDDLAASDPKAYNSFLKEQAKAAGKDLPPGMAGTPDTPEARQKAAQKAAQRAEEMRVPPRATFLMQCGFAAPPPPIRDAPSDVDGRPPSHALVAIWRPNPRVKDAAVGAATIDGNRVTGPRDSWEGLSIPIAAKHAPFQLEKPGVGVVRIYEIVAHAEVLGMAAAAEPSSHLRAYLLEHACVFVEDEYGVKLDRGRRTLQVASDAVGKVETTMAEANAVRAAAVGTGAEKMSGDLLQQLSSLSVSGPPQPQGAGTPGLSQTEAPTRSGPLIQEVGTGKDQGRTGEEQGDADRDEARDDKAEGNADVDRRRAGKDQGTANKVAEPVQSGASGVAHGEDRAQARAVTVKERVDKKLGRCVQVTAQLPSSVTSAADVELFASESQLRLMSTSLQEPLEVPLPVEVDGFAVRAKFDRETHTLTVKLKIA